MISLIVEARLDRYLNWLLLLLLLLSENNSNLVALKRMNTAFDVALGAGGGRDITG